MRFHLIDRIIEHESWKNARGLKNLTRSDDLIFVGEKKKLSILTFTDKPHTLCHIQLRHFSNIFLCSRLKQIFFHNIHSLNHLW